MFGFPLRLQVRWTRPYWTHGSLLHRKHVKFDCSHHWLGQVHHLLLALQKLTCCFLKDLSPLLLCSFCHWTLLYWFLRCWCEVRSLRCLAMVVLDCGNLSSSTVSGLGTTEPCVIKAVIVSCLHVTFDVVHGSADLCCLLATSGSR